jgi:hypothetical protein
MDDSIWGLEQARDEAARSEVINHACVRLEVLSRSIATPLPSPAPLGADGGRAPERRLATEYLPEGHEGRTT